jgi:hypothetical protein
MPGTSFYPYDIPFFQTSFSYDDSVPQPLDQDTLDRFCVHLSRLHIDIDFCIIRPHLLISTESLVLIKDGAR